MLHNMYVNTYAYTKTKHKMFKKITNKKNPIDSIGI